MQKLIATSLLAFLFCQAPAVCQNRFFTKSAVVYFHGEGPMDDVEKIEATNRTGNCVLDVETGAFEMGVTMKGFRFKNALMEEHFNENYVESTKFPKGTFKGKIANREAVDFSKDGKYSAQVVGKMTMHGETKDVDTWGQIEVKNGLPLLESTFEILLSDYKIEIPSLVKDKVNNAVKISVNARLEPFKK